MGQSEATVKTVADKESVDEDTIRESESGIFSETTGKRGKISDVVSITPEKHPQSVPITVSLFLPIITSSYLTAVPPWLQ